MKRIWILGALSLIVVAAGLFVGCGSDKGTNATLQPLDTNSATFVEENVSAPAMDGASEDAENVLDLVNLISFAPGAPGAVPSSASPSGEGKVYDTVSHTYENGWHIFYYSFNRVDSQYRNDSLVAVREWTVSGYDSIMIWSGGQPVQYRGAADSLVSHGHGHDYYVDSHDNYGNHYRHRVIQIEGNPWAEVINQLVLNANSHDTLTATFYPKDQVTCSITNTYTGQISDVVFDSAAIYGDACPSSGSLNYVAMVNLDCSGPHDTLSVNGTWSIHATFNGTTTTLSLSNGLAQAVVVDTCGSSEQPATVPLAIRR